MTQAAQSSWVLAPGNWGAVFQCSEVIHLRKKWTRVSDPSFVQGRAFEQTNCSAEVVPGGLPSCGPGVTGAPGPNSALTLTGWGACRRHRTRLPFPPAHPTSRDARAGHTRARGVGPSLNHTWASFPRTGGVSVTGAEDGAVGGVIYLPDLRPSPREPSRGHWNPPLLVRRPGLREATLRVPVNGSLTPARVHRPLRPLAPGRSLSRLPLGSKGRLPAQRGC